jgi:hypothetical protein
MTPSLLLGAAVATGLLAVSAVPATSLERSPTITTYNQCVFDSLLPNKPSDAGCEGLICWCCYADGCYICDSNGLNCTWESGARVTRVPGRLPDIDLLERDEIPPPPPTRVQPGGVGGGVLAPP